MKKPPLHEVSARSPFHLMPMNKIPFATDPSEDNSHQCAWRWADRDAEAIAALAIPRHSKLVPPEEPQHQKSMWVATQAPEDSPWQRRQRSCILDLKLEQGSFDPSRLPKYIRTFLGNEMVRWCWMVQGDHFHFLHDPWGGARWMTLQRQVMQALLPKAAPRMP